MIVLHGQDGGIAWPDRMRGRGDDRRGTEVGPYELDALVPGLATEFPVYAFGTVRTSNGYSLSAHDRDRAARPGVYAVITSDPDEMRRALRKAHGDRR